MRNLTAARIAFDGCGITMADAQKRGGVHPDDVAATLDMLGNLIMATGVVCIPQGLGDYPRTCLEDARAWPKLTADEQLKTLKRLMGTLTTPPPWRRTANVSSAEKPMLPQEMGAWESHNPMPSCWGMLVTMAAFAYQTGSPALSASVQRMSAELVTPGLRSLYAGLRQFAAGRLPHAFAYDLLPQKLAGAITDAEAAVNLMSTRHEFHGAMVFRLADGRWVSLDPYMRNMATLDPAMGSVDQVYRPMMLEPSTALTVLGKPYWQDQAPLEEELNRIFQAVDLLIAGNLIHPGTPLSQVAVIVYEVLAQVAGFKLSSSDDVLRYAFIQPPDWKAPDLAQATAMAAAAESTTRRPQVIERIIMVGLNSWAERAWSRAQAGRANYPHYAIMMASPARMIAVCTIINLRHRLRQPLLAADLLPYSANDIVVYNALLDRQRRRTTSQDDHWIDRRVAVFRQAPPYLLHPLLLGALG